MEEERLQALAGAMPKLLTPPETPVDPYGRECVKLWARYTLTRTYHWVGGWVRYFDPKGCRNVDRRWW